MKTQDADDKMELQTYILHSLAKRHWDGQKIKFPSSKVGNKLSRYCRTLSKSAGSNPLAPWKLALGVPLRAIKAQGAVKVERLLSFNWAPDGVRDQLHVPAALHPEHTQY